MRLAHRLVLAGAFFFVLAALAVGADKLPARTSSQAGVTVKVAPRAVTAQALEFDVTLDTHSQDLGDDLARSAELVVDAGKVLRPTAWQGSAAGGHHRRGVLRFEPVAPPPAKLELRIQRAGEPAPRVFQWQLR